MNTISLSEFDMGAHLCLKHAMPIVCDLDLVPNEYKSTSPPAIGPDDLEVREYDVSSTEMERLRPFVHDVVQIRFRVPAHKGSWTPSIQIGYELMWVSVKACKDEWPNVTYQGELKNIPVFIGPERLQIGSAVTFKMANVVALFSWAFSNPDASPYVTINSDGKPWLTVDYGTHRLAYPLTEAGIRNAGRDLYGNGKHDWHYASSVDFPEEHGCDLDVRTTLEGAFVAKAEAAGDKRFSDVALGLGGAIERSIGKMKTAKEPKKQAKPPKRT